VVVVLCVHMYNRDGLNFLITFSAKSDICGFFHVMLCISAAYAIM